MRAGRVWESTDPTSPCASAPREQRAALEVSVRYIASSSGVIVLAVFCVARAIVLFVCAHLLTCLYLPTHLLLTCLLTDREAVSHGINPNPNPTLTLP